MVISETPTLRLTFETETSPLLFEQLQHELAPIPNIHRVRAYRFSCSTATKECAFAPKGIQASAGSSVEPWLGTIAQFFVTFSPKASW